MKLFLDKNSDFSWALDNYGIEAAYAEVPEDDALLVMAQLDLEVHQPDPDPREIVLQKAVDPKGQAASLDRKSVV